MASSTVGTAVIKLSFDGSDVKAELSKTSSQFKNAGTEAGNTFGNAMTIAMGSLISKGVSKIVGAITSNLDSAINRVDVINNFPKVMESLGFSTEEAAESIKTIASRLDGLPSTLNGVVGDVQKLTATMGNLNTGMVNATSLGLALNDMFLAGGKGTEAASNAMEQYNQMLAQGKPDMQSWRSMLNAAPGQLKQLAKSILGATANQQDLYQALMDGVVTFDQMNEAIVRLDQEGGEGFDSFERQARAATGGVGTALENVQNRISKAIAKVIDVIGADNIANAINDISRNFEGIGVEVGKFVKGAMQNVGEFIRFLQNNTWIVETIKGAVASLIAMGIGYKIMQLKDKVIALFAALAAHPILAVISAIVGLGTAISGMVSQESDLMKAMKATKEECDQVTKSWSEMAERRQASLDKGMSELAYYESLQKELAQIVDENGKVKNGYEERAKFITSKLSDALGIEIKLQDGVIQQHKELQSEITKTIEYKKAELKLKAFEEQYTQAINDRAAAAKRLTKIELEIQQALEENSYAATKRAIELSKSYEEQESLVGEYSATIKGYEADLAAFTEGRYNDMSNAAWNWVDDLIKAEQTDEQTLQRAIRETETSLNTNKRLYEKYGDEVYMIQARKDEERLNSLRTKMGAYNNVTASSLNTNKNTWSSALSNIVNQAWNKGSEMVKAGANLSNALATGERNAMNNPLSAIVTGVSTIVNTAKNQAWQSTSVGQMIMLGIRNGMNSNMWTVLQTVGSFCSDVFNTVKGFFGIHSPSRLFRDEVGAMLALGVGLGFEDEMSEVAQMMNESIPTTLEGPSLAIPAYQQAGYSPAYATLSGAVESAIIEQSGAVAGSNINVYMNNTIDNDMSIDELGRKLSQSIRRYA